MREPEGRSGAMCSFSLDPQVPMDYENAALYLLILLTLAVVFHPPLSLRALSWCSRQARRVFGVEPK